MSKAIDSIQDLVKELTPTADSKPKTYTAEVSHTDEEGIVWVRLPGADQDTPTASTSAEVKMGDTVTVEWRNNKLYIAGNYTNPSAGVARVAKAEQTAEKAVSDAETARTAAESAQEAAAQAITIAGDTDQHFWFTETGTDTGAHITEEPQDDFLADPSNGGANLLARSNGIAVRDGLAELATFAASGVQIGQTSDRNITVDTNGLKVKDGSTVAASFGASSATIGKTSSKNVVVDSNGMTLKNGSSPLATITATGANFSTSGLSNAVKISSDTDAENTPYGTIVLGGNNGPTIEGLSTGNYRRFSIDVRTNEDSSETYETGAFISVMNAGGALKSYLDLKPDDGFRLAYYKSTGGAFIEGYGDHVTIGAGAEQFDLYSGSMDVSCDIHVDKSGPARVKALNLNTGYEVGMASDASSNIGLYDYSNSEWLIRKDASASSGVYCGGRDMSALLVRADFTTTQHSTSTGSIAADSYSSDKTATFTNSGYYPYGIVGVNIAGTNRVHQSLYTWRLSSRSEGSATVTYSIRNRASVAFSGTIYFDILWIRVR